MTTGVHIIVHIGLEAIKGSCIAVPECGMCIQNGCGLNGEAVAEHD